MPRQERMREKNDSAEKNQYVRDEIRIDNNIKRLQQQHLQVYFVLFLILMSLNLFEFVR